VIFGLAFLAVLVLSLRGRIDPGTVDVFAFPEDPMALYGVTPYVAEGVLIFAAVLAYTAVECVRQFWRYAKVVERRWLRRGLRIVALGSCFTGVLALAIGAYVLGLRLGVTTEPARQARALLDGTGIMISVVGATMPMWGPRWDRIRAYRILHPLWLALYRAAPDVVLDPPTFTRIDRWKLWDIDFRLYRRVIEIRDGFLALRPYCDERVASAAHHLGRQSGLDGEQLQVTVDAAVLTAAIAAKVAGRQAGDQAALSHTSAADDHFSAELTWLTGVLHAFVGSPVVAAASQRPVQPVAT
jgi:hypothetical protein